jgi:methionyl-tRNA formyltransferase
MRIALLCATRRGHVFLERLAGAAPDCDLSVFSFQEEPWEPRFLEDIRTATKVAGGEFREARNVGSPRLQKLWESTPVDLMLVVSWRYLIPPRVYERPRLGTYVFHDSLLPAYRGFSPTVWAILNGETHTGVSLFQIAEDVDSGDIVDQERVPIGPDETIREVSDRVTQTYLTLLDRNLDPLLQGNARRTPQDHSKATYTCKRLPEDNVIDWQARAQDTYNLIRGVTDPYPGAFTFLEGRRLRVWSASRTDSRYVGRVPGRVVKVIPGQGSEVLVGDDALLLHTVQLEGEERTCASDILNRVGMTLGRPSWPPASSPDEA